MYPVKARCTHCLCSGQQTVRNGAEQDQEAWSPLSPWSSTLLPRPRSTATSSQGRFLRKGSLLLLLGWLHRDVTMLSEVTAAALPSGSKAEEMQVQMQRTSPKQEASRSRLGSVWRGAQ